MLIRVMSSVAGEYEGELFSYRGSAEVDVPDGLAQRLVDANLAVYLEDQHGEPIVMLKRRGRPPKNTGPTEFKAPEPAKTESVEPKTVGPAKPKDK